MHQDGKLIEKAELMKNNIILAGAIAALVLVGATFGGFSVYSYGRMNGLQQEQAQIIHGANTELQNIRKEIEGLKIAMEAKKDKGEKR